MKALFLCAVIVFAMSAVYADSDSANLKGDDLDPKSAMQFELVELENAVALLKLPLPLNDAMQAIGKDRIRWSERSGVRYKEYRRDWLVFDVTSPALKDQLYVVVFEAEQITETNPIITRVSVGYQTPAGWIYFADLRDAQRILKKDGEPGATDNPDDAHRLREDH